MLDKTDILLSWKLWKSVDTYVDKLSVAFIISSNTITEISALVFKYLPFW